MAAITDDHQAEQKAILPRVRPLRLLRWVAAVLALVAGTACLLLLVVENDLHDSVVLSAAALALVANAGLALAALIPDAREA